MFSIPKREKYFEDEPVSMQWLGILRSIKKKEKFKGKKGEKMNRKGKTSLQILLSMAAE